MSTRVTGLAIATALGGCSKSAVLPAARNAALEPISFFTGRTHGEGELRKLLSRPVKVTVDSIGRKEGDRLVLDQIIREGDKPPRIRRWTMRLLAPNRYSVTLTDATGPVLVTASGPRVRIRYTMPNGLHVEQQLALQSDDRTVLNRLEVHKFGVRVASLNETIRKRIDASE